MPAPVRVIRASRLSRRVISQARTRFSRAVRWLKAITRTEAPTSSPNSATISKQGIHETPQITVADQEKKSLAILCFRNLHNDPASSFTSSRWPMR